MIKLCALFLLFINTTNCIAMTSVQKTPKELDKSLNIKIPFVPEPFRFGDKIYITYELEIINQEQNNLIFEKLVIFNQKTSQPIKFYDQNNLNIKYFDINNNLITATDAFQTAQKALIFVWLEFSAASALATELNYKLAMRANNNLIISDGKPITIPHKKPMVIGSPFRKPASWYVANGPAANSTHREAVIPLKGPMYLPQRFAIDFVSVNEQGRSFAHNGMALKDWYCYGEDVVAVADGIITSTKNDMIENDINGRAVPINFDTALGNHVALKIDDDHLAVYAHLIPGSLTVKVGDMVRKGQVLGKIGNSGNSDAPHLHFHMCVGPSPLLSQGQSYSFESFETLGKSSSVVSLLTGGDVFSVFSFEKQKSFKMDQLPLENFLITLPSKKENL